MSLVRRLALACGLSLSMAGAALLYGIVYSDVQLGRAALERRLGYEIDSGVAGITEPVLLGDYARIEQLLRMRVAQPGVAHARFSDHGGHTLEAHAQASQSGAPDWFATWAGLGHGERVEPIAIGGREYGRLTVVLDPAPMLDGIWHRSLSLMKVLVAGIAVFFLVTLGIVNTGLRPISALAAAARRFGEGDHTVRLDPAGSPEVATSMHAFNNLADSVESLVKSLDESRAILFAEKEQAQVTLASIADAVISTDPSGRVAYLNPVAERLTGWSLQEAGGRLLGDVFRVEADATGRRSELGSARHPVPGRSTAGRWQLVSRDGSLTPIVESTAPMRDRDQHSVGVVVVFRDVSESRKLAEQLSWQATHDALTGLVNRREFERRLTLLVQEAQIDRTHHALLYIDLDQFKVVNDTCGHVAGDEMLRQAAALLQRGVRDSDTLARLGGDEFGVLLHGCALERAMEVAEQLRHAMQDMRFAWDERTFSIAVSIGVAGIQDDDEPAERVLAAADAACYSAKGKGRNRVQAYRPDDAELKRRRSEMHWVVRIRGALENESFRLDCQRIQPISRAAGSEQHYEVLLRMVDEDGSLIPPMAFIPAAERYNLMPSIDRYVLERTFAALGAARRAGPSIRFPVVAVNLSGASLSDEGLFAYVRARLDAHSVPPASICFEVTETAAIANLTAATRLMRDIRGLGCQFSLDDFGSGLSSFAYLKHLPVDFLKIDGSFVKDMAKDPIDSAMVRAINDIGHVMGIRTIAEWVESDEALAALRALGVDYAQGFGVERPGPFDQMLAGLLSPPLAQPALAPVKTPGI